MRGICTIMGNCYSNFGNLSGGSEASQTCSFSKCPLELSFSILSCLICSFNLTFCQSENHNTMSSIQINTYNTCKEIFVNLWTSICIVFYWSKKEPKIATFNSSPDFLFIITHSFSFCKKSFKKNWEQLSACTKKTGWYF